MKPSNTSASHPPRYYTISYQDAQGTIQHLRRAIPPKMHPYAPEDKVVITSKKNDHWHEGREVTVKEVGPRQPNTLTVRDEKNVHTFLSYRDVGGQEGDFDKVKDSKGRLIERRAGLRNDYLLWP